MLTFWKKKRLKRLTQEAVWFVGWNYLPPRQAVPKSDKIPRSTADSGHVQYSLRSGGDRYNANEVSALMKNADKASLKALSAKLEQLTDLTFTEKLMELIAEKGLRDA